MNLSFGFSCPLFVRVVRCCLKILFFSMHKIARLIRTAVNIAKDIARSAESQRTVPLEELDDSPADDSCTLAERAAMRAMLSLDELYRLPLYL